MAAALVLLAAGLALLGGGLPVLAAQGAALLAVAFLVAAMAGLGRAGLLAAAALLGLARAPWPVHESGPARPVRVEGRLLEWSLLPEGGWLGILDRLRHPQGGPLDQPDRRLSFLTRQPGRPPAAGSRLQVEGLLVSSDAGPRLERAGWLPEAGPPAVSLLGAWRTRIRHRIDRVLDPAEAGMARALLLGDRQAVPEGRSRAYRRLGLLHLLAVSGLHIWLWDALLRRLLIGPLGLLRIPLLLLAALLSGGRPPVVRALAALFLRDLMARRGFRVRGSALWAAALFAELALVSPRPAGIGLLLSYSATAAILMAGRGPNASAARSAFRISLAAFLGTAPWLHALQGTVEPWSVLLTPPAALLLPVRLSLSWLALLPGAGAACAALLALIGGFEEALISFCERLPGSPLALPALSSWVVACLCLGGLAWLRPAPARTRRACLVLAALAALVAGRAAGSRPGILALQVGHGLAVAVGGRDQALLFDLGSREISARRLVDRELLPGLARRLLPLPHHLVLSHPDSDHVNAVEHFRSRHALQDWDAPPGVVRELPGFQPWRLRLYGCRSAADDASNAGGLALEARSGPRRALLLGDQFGYSLRDLAARLDPGPVDVLLAPHHGLTTDGLPEILARLQPREVWISCGADDLPWPAGPAILSSGALIRSTLDGPLWLGAAD